MFEALITTDEGRNIYLKYDKEEYSVEYVKNKNIILLRRLSDNQIKEVFSDKIGFIVQCNKEKKVNFLVTDYSEMEKNGDTKIMFKHYIDKNFSDSLCLKEKFECSSISISQCRITDSSYLIEQKHGWSIYNLDKKTKMFERVYNDEKVKMFFDDNTILVSDKRDASLNFEISDTLTYGINPETLEITTPIWSELQQRWIPIYTQQQVDKLREEEYKNGFYLATQSLGEMTIYFEIQRYLEKIDKQLDKPQNIYLDSRRSKVNEKFIKKFVKK